MTPRLVALTLKAPVEVVALRPELVRSPTLVVSTAPGGGAAEAMGALRTDLMARHFQAGRRALAVCAASAGVGCSFVASNLAVALSQIGMRTLLIDANLRSPILHTIFGATGSPRGLSDCLASDDEEFGRRILNDLQPNLSVIYAGDVLENPQELLAGRRFRDLVGFCLREFDATILDTAPSNVCADARRVSTVAGYSLIVARRNVTYVDDLKTLAGQLTADHARVVGCVLNEA